MAQDIAAIILAAGASERMGQPKALLPFGKVTILEHVIGVFRQAGVEELRVVVGHHADRLSPLLDRAGVTWVLNPHPESGMFSSVEAGIASLPSRVRAFFVHPVDIPLVSPRTLRRLMRAQPAEVVSPRSHGKTGHPPLLDAGLIPALMAFDGPGGLRGFLAQHRDHTCHIDCDDEGILVDVDTPQDYCKACQTLSGVKGG
ncbi:MAG: nucleotidyltransferase family protein [Kiritimatiellia bacterium]|jgi:CTP:molybdopterin cytidylyltransferase MocA|nr:nucleotidyltransferase family protein [Kiritimatiellia bacterium]MDP6631762.1 nucleotidyltransferase family protein [Kiritimatiellia bacterium]MDP6810484.1 nucleotidyltransferase family protein [Kiritimatiellia bacterium]MDP7024998.1 nucleotidyltransferase family protein [Kiritimatiellia bacterium]